MASAPPIPLVGYAGSLSGRAGEKITFHVSSVSSLPFTARLVRIICSDPNPDGPGQKEEVQSEIAGSYPSRIQPFFSGSYVTIHRPIQVNPMNELVVKAKIWPTLPSCGRLQVVLAMGSLSIALDGHGRLCASCGTTSVCTATSLRARRWYSVGMKASPMNRTLMVSFEELPLCPSYKPKRKPEGLKCGTYESSALGLMWEGSLQVTIAARMENGLAKHHFNGKIEGPEIWQAPDSSTSPPSSLVARWDFSAGIHSTAVTDTGAHELHGRIVNLPTRGVTSSAWDGSEMRHSHKPEHYAAIHFHEDDIYDFGWEPDFSLTVPESLPSGVYAARIECDGAADAIPFFVCPPKGKRRADLCVLMSTFTYVVYGNHARPDYTPTWRETVDRWQAYPHNPAAYPQYGLSTYNFHSDGSGICYASHRRPLFNVRPGFRTFGYGECSGLRHLPADTHLIAWLHHKGIQYDVITDQELHDEGVDVIEGYKCVTTGTHPEYHTSQTMDALEEYRDSGGKLAYLGGDGFYWRVALHSEPSQRGTIEIRRAEGGIRAWAAETGEYYHSFDGEYGGLWRRNGRAPQTLVGVGFSTQCQFQGTHYRIRVRRDDPEVGWILDGIEGDTFGGFGFSGGGAAGFELDRADERLGTPEHARVVASSEGHPASSVLVPEEVLTHLTTLSGEAPEDMLRADMVYVPVPGGGAVFAVGSITFCGSLPWNRFDNDVSRLLSNVFRRFLP